MSTQIPDGMEYGATWFAFWFERHEFVGGYDELHLCYPDPATKNQILGDRQIFRLCEPTKSIQAQSGVQVRNATPLETDRVCPTCSRLANLSAREKLATGESVLRIGERIVAGYRLEHPYEIT